MNIYLHSNKPAPQDLIPIATRALRELSGMELDLDWDCNVIAIAIAKADSGKGFALFRDQIVALSELEWLHRESRWSPFQRHGSHDFWRFLCDKHPERACRELITLQNYTSRMESVHLAVDFGKNLEAVLRVATEDEESAIFCCRVTSGAEKGFFQFAYRLMEAFPGNQLIRATLADTAIYRTGKGVEWDNYKQALSGLEAELQSGLSDSNHLGWLNEVKQRMTESAAVKQNERRTDVYLDWS